MAEKVRAAYPTWLEDIVYAKAAELAIKEGFASDKEAQDLLDSL